MMTPVRFLVGLLAVVLACAGCGVAQMEKVEQSVQGPTSMDVLTARSQAVNGRDPNFDERRLWENRTDLRISKYLREHPELEQSARYMEVRFYRQVTLGAPRAEVEALIEKPQEETIDPALMAVLAERHWDEISRKATEAWIYYGWVIFFDDQSIVVGMTRRFWQFEPQYD
jgi:hypothetical protein